MEPVPGELPHLIGPTRQKLPELRIGTAGGGVVPKHLRPVVLGVDSEADEPNILPLELALDHLQRVEDTRTDVATPGEGEMRDPHQGIQLGGAEAVASLIGQRERREFEAGAGRKEIASRRSVVCGTAGRRLQRCRAFAGATTEERSSARNRKHSRE